ncbi:hypothetical protein MKS83_13130 [Chryseobacterium sp. Y16C]|uniref:hypothetical protein n=1 Tax=Chryseobacterium sp. Y16C TaxID=2920939 RepID=UPI001F0A2F82|nr:hypothetical protein [Chryseobacterium sp. Y16C]UMQ40340.1 hypothetical protein MKS83_13130 [Chryseobacterium sp. Y16C]
MRNLLLGLTVTGFLIISCKKDERPTYIKDENGSQPVSTVNNTPKASLMAQAGIQTAQPSQMVTASGMNPPHGQPGHRCDIPVGQPLNAAPTQNAQPGAQNITVNANQGQTIQIDPNSLKQVNNTNKPGKIAPGMNPPHGEPGHRCDIPVGQPLNSKPAVAQQSVQTIAQNTPAPTPTPAPTGPKPELNPPHGEPWHDCAKKVGDPL